ncbi:MAG TPA: hypothetical protein DCL77_20140 [Prolixibacteraceae bacterium]|nr:hypothetical protein [Prolixibacteraceae bacterium]
MWWNIKHNWQPGMRSWRGLMHITPGYLGPNALPVPNMEKGVVPEGTSMELGADFYFRTGDPTQDISAKYYRSFANERIGIELYGVVYEHYNMSDTIRDERIARDFNGKGYAIGDFYFATLLQLIKGKKFPDTMLRLGCRTASGGNLEAARYSDSPGYFIDFSFSKEFADANKKLSFRPYASGGFYCWQTNDDFDLQNDALLYGVGADLKYSSWSVSNSLSGYSGYKNERDRPKVYTFDLKHTINKYTLRLQYLYGLRDWTYQGVKLSMIWNLKK